MSQKTSVIGFPRIGENRELKKALESFWSKKISQEELERIGSEIRKKNWLEQKEREIDYISSNDFSFYDLMLDMTLMLNAVPKRFLQIENKLERLFAMARGNDEIPAMAMVKWFNTNYHYIVPEFESEMNFTNPDIEKIKTEYNEAKKLGIKTKINIIGPITFVALSKLAENNKQTHLSYFEKVLAGYKKTLEKISELDDEIILQIDEPIFVKNLSNEILPLIKPYYKELSAVAKNIKIIVSTYFEHASEAVKELAETEIWGIGLDFIYGEKNMSCLEFLKNNNKILFAGVIDGRNLWANDLDKTNEMLKNISLIIPKENIVISTSCSLLHTPYSLKNEPDSEIKKWFAFCTEKLDELSFLGRAFYNPQLSWEDVCFITRNRNALAEKYSSEKIYDKSVTQRIAEITKFQRNGEFDDRNKMQKKILNLPILPTTTIGSFPQTKEIRKIRSDFKKKAISQEIYETAMKNYIDDCVERQEKIGLDVLVHGEPERNDMVEYFGELLNGFHFTQNGWVQSYGSRCVKPPVIFGDISRREPMTLKWILYAQSKTKKIMKGMLTGPATIINWSFVRNDIQRSVIAKQIALALSDEIDDLQKVGIKIIQLDEAAFKEGYPLRSENISAYEKWAVDSFKLAVSSANMQTQIHTHMCYSEFNDIIKTIEAMDADVITIETARSGNTLLNVFKKVGYKNEIGPGVFDIHSPRVPSVEEFEQQIKLRMNVISPSKFWVNPDCGLKTRQWTEVEQTLENMVKATLKIRKEM